LSAIYCTPGPDNSNRIKTEKAVPTKPENKANIRYNVPISFALEDKNHLSFHIVISSVLPKVVSGAAFAAALYSLSEPNEKFEVDLIGIYQTFSCS